MADTTATRTYRPRRLKTPPSSAAIAYTIETAIEVTGIGRDRLYDAIRERRIVAKKWGNRTLIVAESLRRFIDELPDAIDVTE